MGTWLRRLMCLLRWSRHEAELQEEMETHRALRAAQLERDGLTPPEAAAASRRAIGNVLLAREDVREAWLGSSSSWWQDVRYGLRIFRRNPTFTAVAVLTLALGIGVNAGIFTVVNALLFRDLTAPDAHELVSIVQSVQGVPNLAGAEAFATSEYFTYRDRAQTFAGLAAYGQARGEATLDGESSRRVLGALVSCNFFAVLQQPPAIGRGFVSRDCEQGADLVVVLSHELWRSAFAADPGIAGRTIRLNRQLATVVGVAAEGSFNGIGIVGGGYLAPLNVGRQLSSGDVRYDEDDALWLNVLGRRRDGVGLAAVRAELDVIASQIDRQRPGRSTTLTIERGAPAMPQQLRRAAVGASAVMMGAFGLVLLIACANVANLLLARATSRSHEIAIRASLGASRARVIRQLVTESVLLSLAGGVLGSAVAVWSFQALVALAVPALMPPWFPLSLTLDLSADIEVLVFALALTIGTGVLFGLAPALQASRGDVPAVMKQRSPGTDGGRRGGRLRATLVGVQVALCMVLAIAAGLLLRGLHATYAIDPGFEYQDVALISLESAFDGYDEEEAEARRRRLVASLVVLPGVEAVASSDHKPLGDDSSPDTIRLPGEDERESRVGEVTTVTEDYFAVLGLPIVRGRAFSEDETSNRTTGPAIVSATTARNLWPGADPIGRTLLSGRGTLQVVGVAADAQVSAIGRVDPYHVYVPGQGAALLIKRRGDIATTVAAVRDALRDFDPALVVPVLPLEATLDWSRGIAGTVSTLFGVLAILAVVLAAVGVYGVVSYSVTGRYREIGVRLALGATAPSLLGLILRQIMRPVIVGAVIGVVAASAVSRVLSSVLFGVSPADPVGLGGATVLVLAVAFGAGLIAAWPATGTDPIATLRAE